MSTEQPTPEQRQQMLQQQTQMENQSAARQMAQQAAGGELPSERDEGYWEVIGDPDIARDEDDTLAEWTATEFSDKFALGNIQWGDWYSWQWQIENEFDLMKNEFVDPDSALDSLDLQVMYGEQRPTGTDERHRRSRSAQQVKKLMTSLSVGARGLRSGTEIHAVAKTENEEPEEPGTLGRLKNKLV